MGCLKEGHNKKGSPKRLGKPEAGESRNPTAFEVEYAGLRRSDVIVRDADGRFCIMRCPEKYNKYKKAPLSDEECRVILECLEEYWSR